MRCFGIKREAIENDSLTIEEGKSIKSLRNNKNIVIKRADKGGGTIVMDSTYYEGKLTELISDRNKSIICDKKQSENIKKENLYGLPKMHKNQSTPPLRPIVSMVGTVTHDIAKYINQIIRPYLKST